MRTSVTVPDDVAEEIRRVAETLKESTSTVLRLAIRAGLPTIAQGAPRPEGYFTAMYESYPQERLDLEAACSQTDVGAEERDRT